MQIVRALLKRFAGTRVKQRIWDREFGAGKWNYMDERQDAASQKRDFVLDVLDLYSTNGDILDLGCGTGRTGFEIADHYRSYVGVDISAIAVQKATAMLELDAVRSRKNQYLVADVLNFAPEGKFAVILFRESVYYFPLRTVIKIIRRYADYLTSSGVIIVRLHDRKKYARIIKHIEDNYRVIDRAQQDGGNGVVLVFGTMNGNAVVRTKPELAVVKQG